LLLGHCFKFLAPLIVYGECLGNLLDLRDLLK
jgi:hypothetical protein